MNETADLPLVVALETDLSFAAQITDAVYAAGAQPLIVSDASALWAAIDRWPVLILIDVQAGGWEAAVRRAKSLPHTRAIPVWAIGGDEETARLAAARMAGCDQAWLRAHLSAELPDLLRSVLHPPTRWVAGWDEPPPAALCRGAAQFNAAEFWECHETLEALWLAEPRPVRDLYQGILQVGIACHHLQERNYAGAIKMFRRGLPRLGDLPEVCQGVAVARFYQAARALHDRAVALGAERIDVLAQANMPHIEIAGCAAG